jgi:glycosyltransferase involved in cell wall biosynthesis
VRLRHDAIYVARLRPFKRHALAKNVSSILILTDHGEDVPAFCPDVAHAEFNQRRLSPYKVSERINEARVGLCLSAEEGAMRASVEYLLCGLPVVTTESRGGREVFFDEMNSITVPPDSAAVAEAVNTWTERGRDTERIRSRTIARLKSVRNAYCRYLSSIFSRIGAGSICSDDLYASYFGPGQGLKSRFLSRRQLRVPQRLDKFALERTEHRNGSPNPQ